MFLNDFTTLVLMFLSKYDILVSNFILLEYFVYNGCVYPLSVNLFWK